MDTALVFIISSCAFRSPERYRLIAVGADFRCRFLQALPRALSSQQTVGKQIVLAFLTSATQSAAVAFVGKTITTMTVYVSTQSVVLISIIMLVLKIKIP